MAAEASTPVLPSSSEETDPVGMVLQHVRFTAGQVRCGPLMDAPFVTCPKFQDALNKFFAAGDELHVLASAVLASTGAGRVPMPNTTPPVKTNKKRRRPAVVSPNKQQKKVTEAIPGDEAKVGDGEETEAEEP